MAGVTLPNSITLDTVIAPDLIRIMQKATPVRFAKTEKICLANCGKNETTASTAACALSLTAILLPIRINQMIKYLAISSDQTKDMLKAYLKTT